MELTQQEIDFLQLLPVDAAMQGWEGAHWLMLTKDLGITGCDQDRKRAIRTLIRGLKHKGITIERDGEFGDRFFLSTTEFYRVRPLIDDTPNIYRPGLRAIRRSFEGPHGGATIYRTRRGQLDGD